MRHRYVWLGKNGMGELNLELNRFPDFITNGNLSPSSQMNWIILMLTGNYQQKKYLHSSASSSLPFLKPKYTTQELGEYAHEHKPLFICLFTAIFVITGLTLFTVILTAFQAHDIMWQIKPR